MHYAFGSHLEIEENCDNDREIKIGKRNVFYNPRSKIHNGLHPHSSTYEKEERAYRPINELTSVAICI